MRREIRLGLFAWVALAGVIGVAVDAIAGVGAVQATFLVLPAGFVVALFATAGRHYLGAPPAPPAPTRERD